jgi:hypothetical protein
MSPQAGLVGKDIFGDDLEGPPHFEFRPCDHGSFLNVVGDEAALFLVQESLQLAGGHPLVSALSDDLFGRSLKAVAVVVHDEESLIGLAQIVKEAVFQIAGFKLEKGEMARFHGMVWKL